jgi:putative PIN family toxin of toxin-antitoxin system
VIRVVLDTNVLVSAVRAESGPLAVIREGWLSGRFQVYVSEPVLDEVERTLTKPYFAERLGPERTNRFLSLLRRTAVLQAITDPVSGVATHPEDDWILATAKNASAQFLITEDRALQSLGAFGPTRLIDPASFADFLESTGEGNRS